MTSAPTPAGSESESRAGTSYVHLTDAGTRRARATGGVNAIAQALDKSDVERAMREATQSYFLRCYRDGLARHPGLHGSVGLSFTVSSTGSVETATVRTHGSSLDDSAVVGCVVAQMHNVHFRPPSAGGGPAQVSYQVIFSEVDAPAP